MSETELGHLWDVTPEKGDINKFVQEMPNYEDPNIREGNSEDYKKKKTKSILKFVTKI